MGKLTIIRIIKKRINNSDNLVVVLIFILVILFRVPHMIMLANVNDPGGDGASYFSLAKNLALHKGYILNFKELFNSYLDTSEPYKHEISYICTWFPPVYPVISAFFLKIFGIKIFSLILANVFLHLLTVITLFRICRTYLDKVYSLIICVLFSLTPLIFSLSVTILSETAYLFFVLLAIYFCIQYDLKKFERKSFLQLLIICSLTLLTRNIAIFTISAVFFWLVSLKQYKRSLIFLLVILTVFLFWEVGFSYLSHHHITSRYFTTWTQSRAFLGNAEVLQSSIVSILKGTFSVKSISSFFQLIFKMPSSSFISIFTVILIFLVAKKNRTNVENLLLINTGILMLSSFLTRSTLDRYFVALIPLLLVAGASLLNNKRQPLPYWLNNRVLLVTLGFFFTAFSYSALKSLKDTSISLKEAKILEEQYLTLDLNGPNKNCIASYPMVVNYLLGNETLILPVNVKTAVQLESLVDQYRIDYFIVTSKDSGMINSDLYRDFFLRKECIKLNKFEFVLKKNNKDLWVYLIKMVA
ncbi:MAG: hypothetical protein BWX96_02493 [Bacteroidetes bacterium ADurb.Bin145]|nr:MAG: hypothetical protein BWX96_02493 [Bacteroidetes bacterium ADurb.Bin145]